jgi:hypothetical protein
MLRRLVRENAPGTTEIMFRGVPAFKGKGILAVISPTRKDITFSFSKGAAFKDRYGLLRGAGKISRHLKIRSPEAVSPAALRYYLKQALDLDSRQDETPHR